MAQRRKILAWLAVPTIVLTFCWGCGVDPRDWNNQDTASRFTIDYMVPVDTFDVVEPFPDWGCDMIEDTDDFPEEGNVWPDACEGGKAFQEDRMNITFSNTPRPGVDETQPIYLSHIVVSYRDGNHQKRTFAPDQYYELSGTVPANGSLILSTKVDDLGIKSAIFDALDASGTPEEWDALWTWDFIVTAYGEEAISHDKYVASASLTVELNMPSLN